MKAAEVEPNEQLSPDCVVFDAMRLLNEMNTKKFKTGNDLLNEFLRRIDVISSNAQIRIVSFETYRESSSLKDSTRISGKKRSIPPGHFNICFGTDIERVRAICKQYNKEVPNRAVNASGNKAYERTECRLCGV